MILTSRKVQEVFLDCLFKEEELVDGVPILDPVIVEGIMIQVGFHPQRLESHKEDVISLVNELPSEFSEGWSFLNVCMDKHGNQWGEHRNCEQLVVLAVGLGLAYYSMPKELWHIILPGGVPYIQFNLNPAPRGN